MCIEYTIFRVNHEVYGYHTLLNTSYSNNTLVPSDSNSASLLLSNFQRDYAIIYAILMVSLIVTATIRCTIFVNITTKASINLHNQMFNSIIRTTMFFFNTNSTGIVFYFNCLCDFHIIV